MQKMSEKEAIVFLSNAVIESERIIEELKKVKHQSERVGKVGEYYSNIENCLKENESCIVAIQALEEIQQYRALEQRLQSVYGEHDGLLEIIVNGLVKYENAPDMAYKAVLLTDDDVDKWKQYKAIGTVEECRDAVERMKPKGFIQTEKFNTTMWQCPICYSELYSGQNYCDECGNLIGWDGLE